MVVLDDIKLREKTLKGKLDDLFVAVDADKLRVRRAELETLQQDPDLYKDVAKAAKINGEAKFLDERIATVDRMAAEMTENHIVRLRDGICTPDVGAQYLALTANAERVADHCINVAKTIRAYS